MQRVEGASGFVRAGGPLEGKVSLVIGGGSGHYPSYNGVVGTGFADGAVLGDLFASPSAEQVYRVARAADGGAGVVLGFGNYAGDRLNFGVAAERLIDEGIDTRIVYVTDDVASASPEEQQKRRGIAGTFTVYKIAAAAAENGANLDEVERVMRAANAATYSFGVAFHGCTTAGRRPAAVYRRRGTHGLRARHPRRAWNQLGSVDDGQGPGSQARRDGARRAPRRVPAAGLPCSSTGLARPSTRSCSCCTATSTNSSKRRESCRCLLRWASWSPASTWPAAPCRSPGSTTSSRATGSRLRTPPAFRRGTAVASERFTTRRAGADHVAETVTAEASEESIAAAAIARKAVDALYAAVEENKEYLGRIDAIAGDGDHGIGMSRGSKAAAEAANETEGGVETVLSAAGHAFGDKAGGTSGILWGLLLEGVGKGLGNTEEVTAKRLADAVQGSAQHLQGFSKAELGDKTMLDALFPFVDTLVGQVDAGASLSEAWRSAADACRSAAEATASLTPKIGRARPLAERSVGTPDPGAISLGLIVTAIGDVLGDAEAAAPEATESMDKEGQNL